MIDIQAVNDGDFVEIETMVGTEVGIFKGAINALPDRYEVWVNGRPAAARLVLSRQIINHQPAGRL